MLIVSNGTKEYTISYTMVTRVENDGPDNSRVLRFPIERVHGRGLVERLSTALENNGTFYRMLSLPPEGIIREHSVVLIHAGSASDLLEGIDPSFVVPPQTATYKDVVVKLRGYRGYQEPIGAHQTSMGPVMHMRRASVMELLEKTEVNEVWNTVQQYRSLYRKYPSLYEIRGFNNP